MNSSKIHKMARMILPLSLLLLVSLTTSAQQRRNRVENPDPVIRSIVSACNKVQSITCEFSQEKEMSVMAEKVLSGGKFWFRKEKSLRWEYTSPFSYLIIINGDQMLVRDDQKVNLINIQSNRVFREINQMIIGAIRGTLLEDQKNYEIALEENTGQWIATLIPQNPKIRETLREIVIFFDKRDLTVDRLFMREASGDYTRIIFRDKKINQHVDDALFSLQ